MSSARPRVLLLAVGGGPGSTGSASDDTPGSSSTTAEAPTGGASWTFDLTIDAVRP